MTSDLLAFSITKNASFATHSVRINEETTYLFLNVIIHIILELGGGGGDFDEISSI